MMYTVADMIITKDMTEDMIIDIDTIEDMTEIIMTL